MRLDAKLVVLLSIVCLSCQSTPVEADDKICVICIEGEYCDSGLNSSCPEFSTSPMNSSSIEDCICLPGYYQNTDNPTTHECIPCPVDSFCNNDVRTVCPDFSTSNSFSSLHTDCRCKKGYSGSNGGTCTACNAGEYKDVVGPSTCSKCGVDTFSTQSAAESASTCQACPDNSQSLEGSDAITDCVCDAGYERNEDNCQACVEGHANPIPGGTCAACGNSEFSNAPAQASCSACPANSGHDQTAATSIMACLCDPGYTVSNGFCNACLAGSFKDSSGSAACQPCPSGTISGDGASVCVACPANSVGGGGSIDDCLCLPGFQRNGDVCEACVEGKFKNETSNSACLDCKAGTFSDSTQTINCDLCAENTYQPLEGQTVCQDCITNSVSGNGSSIESQCECILGFTRNGNSCEPCLVGYYKDIISNEACSACPSGYTTSATSSSALSDCQACSGNTYAYTTETGTVCVGCPANSNVGWSPFPLNGIESCKCDPGYTGIAADGCVACELGKYKPTSGPTLCNPCPDGMIGNASFTDTRSSLSACENCAAKTYTQDLTTCADCPANTVSDEGSNDITDCICDVGFYLSGTCQACAAGSIKTTTGNQACEPCAENSYADSNSCQSCPANSQSIAQSSSVTACQCNPGYTGSITTASDSCTACLAGTWKSTVGSDSCQACSAHTYYSGDTPPFVSNLCLSCPDFSTSPASSSSITSCVCNSGYKRVVNTCVQCSAGSYCPNQNSEIQCVTGADSPAGSTDSSSCLCQPGYYGSPNSCTLCSVNSFCPGGETITSCMDHSTTLTLAGRTNISACVCNSGFYEESGSCIECPEDSFCANDAKSNCQANSSSLTGQDSIAECYCDAYFTRDASNNCVQCNDHVICHGAQITVVDGVQVMSAGSVDICGVNSTNVNQKCSCSTGYYCGDGSSTDSCIAPNACSECPAGSICVNNAKTQCSENQTSPRGSFQPDHCVCKEGYYLSGSDCLICPVGSYCSNEIKTSCADFDPLLTTEGPGHDHHSDCLCQSGHFRTSILDSCKLCPKDHYCLPESQLPIPNVESCQENEFTVSAGSTSISSCICGAGFYLSGDAIQRCLPCAEGERCIGGEVLEQFCHTESRTANADHSACVCLEGFEEDANGYCVACGSGYIKTTIGNQACNLCFDGEVWFNSTSCVPCQANSHSSADRTQCLCDTPRVLTNGECTLCAEDQYYDSDACHNCPAHSTTQGLNGTSGILMCYCDPGYIFDFTTWTCDACPVNHYEVDDVCVSCGTGASSPLASSSSAACQCNATACQDFKFGADCSGSCEVAPEACDECATGHFKNFISAIGNTDICQQCPGDQYQDLTGQTACQDCHATRTNKHLGQTSVQACECREGYEQLVDDASLACSACNPGFFKTDHGDFLCSRCDIGTFVSTSQATACLDCSSESPTSGANTTISDAADNVNLCVCYAGYFQDANECKQCVRGTYKSTKGMQACDFCGKDATLHHYGKDEIGATSITHCVPCPDNSGQLQSLVGLSYLMNAVEQCLCFPGHDSFDATNGCDTCAEDVQQYAQFTYKLGTNNDQCQLCDDGDYFVSANQACVTCELLTEGDVSKTHVALAVNSLDDSLRWGTDQSDCDCSLGYTRIGEICHACHTGHFRNVTETLQCTPCGMDEFQDQVASLNCTHCPPNSHTNSTGKTSEIDCLCDAGYELDDTEHICNPCPAGTFSTHGSNVCQTCPENTYSLAIASECTACGVNERSPESSQSQAYCNCLPGFGGNPCSSCSNATYSPGGTPQTDQYPACLSCPDFKTSPTESENINDCWCVPGYGGDSGLDHSLPCAICTIGKYSTGYSLDPCRKCGFGTISDPEQGATTFDACQCNADIGLKEN